MGNYHYIIPFTIKKINTVVRHGWPYAVFFTFVIYYAPYYYGQLDPGDAISYLSVAEKYSTGHFSTAINAYWSPMISWLIALLVKFGVAPDTAFYVIKLLSGLFIIFLSVKIIDLFSWPLWAQVACKTIIAALASYITLHHLSPDALMTALLLFYLYFFLTGKWLTHPMITGLLGASLYFTKAFGFYFFAAHILLYFFWKLIFDRTQKFLLFKKTAIALIVFLSVSGLWMTALQHRYHKWVISSAGNYNHNLMQYGNGTVQPALKMGLMPLPDTTAYNSWEEITLVHTYTDWKPWSNAQNFLLQLKVICRNSWTILKHIYGVNRMSWPALALSVLLLVWYIITRKKRKNTGFRMLVHSAVFILLYAIGYAVVGVTDRYLYIVDIGIVFILFDELVWLQKRELMSVAGFHVLAGLITFQCLAEVIVKIQSFKNESLYQLEDVGGLTKIIPKGSVVATHATNSINVIDYLAKWHNHGGLQAYQQNDSALQALHNYNVQWVLIPDSVQQRYDWLYAESDTVYTPANWKVFHLKTSAVAKP